MPTLAPTIDVGPVELDLRLYAGDGFTLGFAFTVDATGEPWDASGTWAAQVRSPASSSSALLTFAVDDTDAATGSIAVSLNGPQVRTLAGVIGAVWDLQQVPASGEARTWYRGRISASLDVTRA